MMVTINVSPSPAPEVWMSNSVRDPMSRKLYIECEATEVERAAKAIVDHCLATGQDFVDLQVENWQAPIWGAIYNALPNTFRYAVHLDENKEVCGRNIVYKRQGFSFQIGQ